MLRKYISHGGLLVLIVLFHSGCGGSSTGPDTRLEFVEFSTSNPISLLNFLGLDLGGLESYFLVDWTVAVDLNSATKSPLRRLYARAFTANQSAASSQFRGLDMGTVAFASAVGDSMQFSLDLNRTFSPAVGFVYRSFNSPSPGAPRFVPGDSLQFKRSGTVDFDSLTISLSAPSDSICFTSPALNSTLDSNEDLRVTWEGGASTDRILLTMQPVFEFSNGTGFLSGIYEFFDGNPGEFVLTRQQLQEFLEHAIDELALQGDTEATVVGIFVYAAQAVTRQVMLGGRRAVAMAFTSDQLFLAL